MGQQCCASDQTKNTSDGMGPGVGDVHQRATRKLESSTTSTFGSVDYPRDRADTYFEERPNSRTGSITKSLTIAIPEDEEADHNPDFKTPVRPELSAAAVIHPEEMVMQDSDSEGDE